jgi:hypothetical protein
MAALEKEEVGRSLGHMAKKGSHKYHPSVISCPLPFGEVVHNPPRVTHIFRWDGSYVVARPQTPGLGARYWLQAPNNWDTTGHPQVLGRSVGEFIHLISIVSIRWSCFYLQIQIEIQDHPRISPSTSCYMSSGNKNKNHQIQFKKIIT